MKKTCTIIGGGISGLSLAAFANEHFDIKLLEACDKTGGLIQNSSLDGKIRDHAANGWLSNEPAFDELIDLLNVKDLLITANQEKGKTTRWVIKNNKLYALSPKMLFSGLLPFSSKLRVLGEPFISAQDPQVEESLSEFGTRRFGSGVIPELFAPFAAGIFACRPEELSVPAAFPRLWKMEQQYGSLIKAGLQAPKPEKKTILTTLKGGTSQICEIITEHLADKILLNTPALSVKRHKDLWVVSTENQEILSDYLAITCPASIQGKLLHNSFPKISNLVSKISYSSVVVVLAEFPADAFPNPPVGFGALMNQEGQKSGILGTLFTSCIFPSHQKDGSIATRTILGGSILPDMIQKDHQRLQALVLNHHEKLFGRLQAEPSYLEVVKHSQAIPRYEKGHFDIQNEITQFHRQNPTIRLSGNSLFGVAVKDCVRQSKASVQDFLEASQATPQNI